MIRDRIDQIDYMKILIKKYGLFYYTDPDHKTEYTRKQIISLLQKHKFKIKNIDLGLWDTPLSGFIDLNGGFSLSLYKKLRTIRQSYVVNDPGEADGFNIVAQKL